MNNVCTDRAAKLIKIKGRSEGLRGLLVRSVFCRCTAILIALKHHCRVRYAGTRLLPSNQREVTSLDFVHLRDKVLKSMLRRKVWCKRENEIIFWVCVGLLVGKYVINLWLQKIKLDLIHP